MSGCYNYGALFLIRLHGICINRMNGDIPNGAVAKCRDQLCASPGSIEYITVTFNLTSLVHRLGAEMDELGYSIALHTSLKDIKEYVASNKGAYPFQNKYTDTAKVIVREPPEVTSASSSRQEVSKNLQDG